MWLLYHHNEMGATAARTVRPAGSKEKPLCVDLDGTLVRTDTLLEAVLQLIRRRPLAIFQMIAWAFHGRAAFKASVASETRLAPRLLPYSASVLGMVKEGRLKGSPTYLVTGAPACVAHAVASYVGGFDGVIATERDGVNLTSRAKRDELVKRFGEGGFRYAGNSAADFPVWKSAGEVIVVEPTAAVRAAISTGRLKPDSILSERPPFVRELLRAMRPFQWAKNLLIFVPLFASHQYTDLSALWRAVACFCAFSLATSSVYVINDLFDLESDREHPEKRNRPFASGNLPLESGFALAPALLAAAVAVSAMVNFSVTAVMLAYVALVVAYSAKIKRVAMADVILLSGFYTLRVFVGGIATGISISPWLVVLSMFLFLSLAIAKRHSELVRTTPESDSTVPGRDYRATDAPVVLGLGISCGNIAALVLALYVRSDLGESLYARPEWLYGLVPLLIFWLGRLWLVSGRGQLDSDPLMFTLRDRMSWVLLAAGALIAWLAGPS